MKIFKANQKYFVMLGITRHQAIQSQPFNARKLLSFLGISLTALACGGFLICIAKTFREYTESIYMTLIFCCVAIDFISFNRNKGDFYRFVDGWEECVKRS